MHRECWERYPRNCGLAIPTCITARAWRTSRDACRNRLLAVSVAFDGGENVPGIPGTCATRNFMFLERGPLRCGGKISPLVYITQLPCNRLDSRHELQLSLPAPVVAHCKHPITDCRHVLQSHSNRALVGLTCQLVNTRLSDLSTHANAAVTFCIL